MTDILILNELNQLFENVPCFSFFKGDTCRGHVNNQPLSYKTFDQQQIQTQITLMNNATMEQQTVNSIMQSSNHNKSLDGLVHEILHTNIELK